ncbi:acetyltransferase (GNAT) family protein [Tumebacillus sp. BK434]|uniref:GNAT family N-acetyltransferase n=1 Tax=Tumebacillus sp. BK434 TaxID=2512169 RepID=UPI00105326E9|nr:GNAT family N-acetyltransferase [Tumebacillus sp. BK434]TCP54685.1 acetyltransferase (GNAT) family protein [Tumebacillus sp. BK434]
MDELTFRQADRADVPKMAGLFTKRPPKERVARMTRRFGREPDGWYVAELKGEIVGCCQAVFPRPKDCWLQWMRIGPNTQGSGVGGAFADYLDRQVLAKGAEVVRLNTLPGNVRVHAMMGGVRGYTEWARWTRWNRLAQKPALGLARLRQVAHADDAEDVLAWLEGQVGYQASFAAVTCPDDFRKTVSLDRSLLQELIRGKKRGGCVLAGADGDMEAAALYAVQGQELRILQLVAATTAGGLAAAAGAIREAKPVERVSIQLAGASTELMRAIQRSFAGPHLKKHEFYVFGKRL